MILSASTCTIMLLQSLLGFPIQEASLPQVQEKVNASKLAPTKKSPVLQNASKTKKMPQIPGTAGQDKMIQEIQGLRSRFGTKAFGLSAEESNKIFAQELKRLDSEKKKARTTLNPLLNVPPIDFPTQPGNKSALEPICPVSNSRKPGQPAIIRPFKSKPQEKRSRLWIRQRREIARKLDQTADELEELSEYETADRIRAQADAIRMKCRSVIIVDPKTHPSNPIFLPKSPASPPTTGPTEFFPKVRR